MNISLSQSELFDQAVNGIIERFVSGRTDVKIPELYFLSPDYQKSFVDTVVYLFYTTIETEQSFVRKMARNIGVLDPSPLSKEDIKRFISMARYLPKVINWRYLGIDLHSGLIESIIESMGENSYEYKDFVKLQRILDTIREEYRIMNVQGRSITRSMQIMSDDVFDNIFSDYADFEFSKPKRSRNNKFKRSR